MKTYKIWKSLTIGGKPNTDGINISGYAQSMLEKIKWDKYETVNLVKLKVSDLGFKDWVTIKELFAKAKTEGLELCPPQVGLQLRVDYKDQPMDEWICIGMELLTDSDGDLGVFGLERHGDGLWLYGYWAKPAYDWNPSDGVVFSLRKSKTKILEPLESDPLKLCHFELSENDWEYLKAYLSHTKIGKLFLKKLLLTNRN